MKRLRHLIEFALLKFLEVMVSLPPMGMALRRGEGVGTLVGWALKGRDRLMLKNLRAAFPEKSDQDIRLIADGVWHNIGRASVEFIRAPELVREPLEDYVEVTGIEAIRDAVSRKTGVIFIAGHHCNWEINGIVLDRVMRKLGSGFVAISRPMKNPLTNRWVQSRRALGGIPTISHRDAVKGSLRALRQNQGIGILFDQNLYTGGVFAGFFGRPAATTTLPALLHGRTGAPVIFTEVGRKGRKFTLTADRVELRDVPDEQRLQVWTEILNQRMETAVRRKPEYWFWIHDRWKRQAEAAGVEAAL